MTLNLSEIDFDQLWEEAHQELDGSAILWKSTHPVCKGYRQLINLRGRFSLFIQDYEFEEDLLAEEPPAKIWPEFGFHLLGNRMLVNGQPMGSGQNFFAAGPDPGGHAQWPAKQRNLKVDVHIKPQTLGSLLEYETARLPKVLKQLAQGVDEQPYFQFGTTTPAMQVALHQILNCPYQGPTKQIYLESKALELIGLRLDQSFTEPHMLSPSSHCLKEADIERIHQAGEILIDELEQPPSLIDLAQRVGLNDYKLKLGFRQVFGTTAFGYLHRYRMEKAQQLLLQSQLTIAGVAQAIGYTSQSRFCDAFKRQYGLTPRSYRATELS